MERDGEGRGEAGQDGASRLAGMRNTGPEPHGSEEPFFSSEMKNDRVGIMS